MTEIYERRLPNAATLAKLKERKPLTIKRWGWRTRLADLRDWAYRKLGGTPESAWWEDWDRELSRPDRDRGDSL